MEGLTPGRIVHIVWSDGEHYACMVVGLPKSEDVERWNYPPGTVWLELHRPLMAPMPLPVPISYSDGKEQMTWHWIERA